MNYYHIRKLEDYKKAYQASIENPDQFWGEIAEDNFVWRKPWKQVLTGGFQKGDVKWFDGAQLNITENCLDRHLLTQADKTAIIFEPNNPDEEAQHISYQELYNKVNQLANIFKAKGVKKGDRICIYLPMIPELAISLLACARIGAIHSVVFAGFSASALSSRINDSDCKLVITADGSYRGNKTIDLKGIVDEALTECAGVESVLVVKRINSSINMLENRDFYLDELLLNSDKYCSAEIMEAEAPLFILYTSGSTGKPKGMVHTTAGYMVQTAHSFKNAFQYNGEEVYWCTADIGWVTGHSYIVYGPLLNGATTLLFEGVPSYPDYGRFWQVIEKHEVNQFYTAPTAIRALAKQDLKFVEKYDLSTLKVIGSVGEPINDEAWQWYHKNIGKEKLPLIDTWWQTETGSIMISAMAGVTPVKSTFATLPFPGVQLALMDEQNEELKGTSVEGRLCVKAPWPSMARTIWRNHQRYLETYFSAYPNKYFTGDGALIDEDGDYRITGRVDDVIIVSGHNLGTAPIEDVINEHDLVSESAIVGYPHDVKGSALYAYITLVNEDVDTNNLKEEINQLITKHIGPIAKLDKVQFTENLPKTRSGKIMRRILRKIASNELENLGDTSTLLNPECVQDIIENRL